MLISINGKNTDPKTAFISVTSEAFLFGRAVFETIRTYQKKPFRLEDHLERLYASAELIELKPKWTLQKAQQEVLKVLQKNKEKKELKIRVILSQQDLIIMAETLKEKPARMYQEGVKLVSFKGERSLAQAKTLASTLCHTAKAHADHSGAYESVFVNHQGYVLECAYANLFWVKSGKLHTSNKEVLFGITRQTVIELADSFSFKEIKLKDLLKSDEVFITQTTSGILPVSEIDGQKIGKGKPGRVTKELMEKFEESTEH